MYKTDLFGNEIADKNKKATVHGIKIDWLSFTVFLPDGCTQRQEIFDWVSRALSGAMSEMDYLKYFADAKWDEFKPRSPYKFSMRNEVHGINMYYGGQMHVLIELQGKACSLLARDNALNGIAASMNETMTRIDVAVDFKEISIQEMVESCSNNRFKSKAIMQSVTGTTAYVGNRKSDRYARVYEYNEPHDRANEPRVEYVLRKHYAKEAARYLAAYGVNELAQMCNNSFNFDGLPEVANMSEKLPSVSRDKSNDKRIQWLLKQVAPAVRKLLREREIDVTFIAREFIPDEFQESFFQAIEGNNE